MTDHNEDFVSFDKALRQLEMESTELKKLVSEGEIRAFRDGSSMKFKRADLDNLVPELEMDDELDFSETLEDDTGMVTEEISEEDTLLADDEDLLKDEPAAPARSGAAAVVTLRGRSRASDAAPTTEPTWVTAIAILTCSVMLWGFMIAYTISIDGTPKGVTALWAKN